MAEPPSSHNPSIAPRTLLIALSGPSCSGKTTLARLLRDVINNAAPSTAFILHEDDFYKTDADIPVVKTADGRELQDWDCIGSLDLEKLENMLRFVKKEGKVKEGFESMEDQNEVGEVRVDMERVGGWKEKFGEALRDEETKVAIVDGFLLFAEDMMNICSLFDVKLLLRTDYMTTKRRREARKGYVTLEGFWEDPEGYVDQIVWPNYVKDHAFLFDAGDVEGELDDGRARELGIRAMPKHMAEDMTACFEWAAGVICEALKALE